MARYSEIWSTSMGFSVKIWQTWDFPMKVVKPLQAAGPRSSQAGGAGVAMVHVRSMMIDIRNCVEFMVDLLKNNGQTLFYGVDG